MIGGGPLRVPQPVDRQTAARPERHQASREIDAPQHKAVGNNYASTPPSVSRYSNEAGTGKHKKWWVILMAVVGLGLIVLVGWGILNGPKSANTTVDKNKYQAVFFTSGQVYFGKLSFVNNDYLELRDVYYIQSEGDTSANPDADNPEATPAGGSMKLIKLGDEVHGPEDRMIINREQVLFYENLKPDGKVSELIKGYQPGNN